MTRTYVRCEVSAATYREIEEQLRAAGYEHAIHGPDGEIDMHGLAIALQRAARSAVATDVQHDRDGMVVRARVGDRRLIESCPWCAAALQGAEKSVGNPTPCGPLCGAWKWGAERDASYLAIVTELLFPGTEAAGNHVGFSYVEDRLRELILPTTSLQLCTQALAFFAAGDRVPIETRRVAAESIRLINGILGARKLPCGCSALAHEPTQNLTSSPGYRVCSLGWPIR